MQIGRLAGSTATRRMSSGSYPSRNRLAASIVALPASRLSVITRSWTGETAARFGP